MRSGRCLVLGILNGSNVQTRFDQKTMGFVSIDPVREGYTPEHAQQFFLRLKERLRYSGRISYFALAAQAPFLPTDDEDGVPMMGMVRAWREPWPRRRSGRDIF